MKKSKDKQSSIRSGRIQQQEREEYQEKGIPQHELFEISGLWKLNKIIYGCIEKTADDVSLETIMDQWEVVLKNIEEHPEYSTDPQNEHRFSFCFQQCLASADMLNKKHSTDAAKEIYQMLEKKYVELFYMPHRAHATADEIEKKPLDAFIDNMKGCLKYIESAKLNVPSDVWQIMKEFRRKMKELSHERK